MQSFSTWLLSDRSLYLRVCIGCAIFATLAIVDYRKHGPRATRWREYAFLIACVAIAIAYGITNDLITSRISPEYFLFFKGAAERVSSEVAARPEAHRAALDWQAVRIGTFATWSVGLLAGAAILVANTVGGWPRLAMSRLLRLVPVLFVAAVLLAIPMGWLGGTGRLTWTSADFAEMVARDEMRPYRVMCVYGIHLGGYVGAGVGLLAVLIRVILLRRRAGRQRVD